MLKLSDLQWLVRLCRSIATLHELTPRSRQYTQCTELARICNQLSAPYQSVVTLKPDQVGGIPTKKMIQEASLSEQIETQGYHLREYGLTSSGKKEKVRHSPALNSL